MKKRGVVKVPTGIKGFEDLSLGGLPKGRSTLVIGPPGSGKTIFGMEFLYRGATMFSQPGVFVTLEEKPVDLRENFFGFGWDLEELERKGLFCFVDVSPREDAEEIVGDYDLKGLIARIKHAVSKVKAVRVVLDPITALFSQYEERRIIRRDLHLLLSELKQLGVTVVLTAEQTVRDGTLHFQFEEFVADNVVVLYHPKTKLSRERQIEILKFRGAAHLSGVFPMVIVGDGLQIFPLSTQVITGELLLE